MSSISTISNTFLKISIPFCSHKFPIITKKITFSNKNIIIPIQKSPVVIYGGEISLQNRAHHFPALFSGRVGNPSDPDPSGDPQEFPPVGPHGNPPEVPPLTTSAEVDPGGAPPEVREIPTPDCPEPTPEIEFPVPPPTRPDVPPMPPGPDILPPIRPPGPEIDPPRMPPPDVPPVRPPGPDIIPPPVFPPDIKPPPGRPFGNHQFSN